jgi:hypothetical protein
LLGLGLGTLCLITHVAVIEHGVSSLSVIICPRADPDECALHREAVPSIVIA